MPPLISVAPDDSDISNQINTLKSVATGDTFPVISPPVFFIACGTGIAIFNSSPPPLMICMKWWKIG